MKITKFLLCLAPFAIAGLARADEISSNVIELPAVVVEASRVADPVATMRATLEHRVHVSVPTRLTVKLGLVSQLATDDKPMVFESKASTFTFRPARRGVPVL